VNQTDSEGRSALLLAVKAGYEKAVEELLKREDIKVNIIDKEGRTALSWTAEKGSRTMVELLLNSAGVDKDLKDNDGRTAFSWVVENKSCDWEVPIVELLIDAEGIDSNSKDKNGRTPFSWAATAASLRVVEYLIRSGRVVIDEPDNDGRTPLSWSAEYKRLDVVKCLLSNKDVNANSHDFNHKTPLTWATCQGNEKVMSLLAAKDTNTLHTIASARPERPEQVKLLLDAGYEACRLDHRGRTPLHRAVLANNMESVKLLVLCAPESLNMKDTAGSTRLGLVGTKSHSLAELLLEKGARTDGIQANVLFQASKDSLESIICLCKQGETQRLQYMTRDHLSKEFERSLPSHYPRMRLLYVDCTFYLPEKWT
jgi:ankyrin repeat protein